MAHAWLIALLLGSVVSLVIGYNHALERKGDDVLEVDYLARLSETKPLPFEFFELHNKTVKEGLRDNDLGKLFNRFAGDGKVITTTGKEQALAAIAQEYGITLPKELHDMVMNDMGDLSLEDFTKLYLQFYVRVQELKLIEPLEEGDVDRIADILSNDLRKEIVAPNDRSASVAAASDKEVLQSAIDGVRAKEVERWDEEWFRKNVANVWNSMKSLVQQIPWSSLDSESLNEVMSIFNARHLCLKIGSTSSSQRILRVPLSETAVQELKEKIAEMGPKGSYSWCEKQGAGSRVLPGVLPTMRDESTEDAKADTQ